MLFQTDFVKISFIQIEPSTEIPIYFDYMVWSVANAEDLANGAMPRYTISIPCFIQSDPSGWRRASDVNFWQWSWVRGRTLPKIAIWLIVGWNLSLFQPYGPVCKHPSNLPFQFWGGWALLIQGDQKETEHTRGRWGQGQVRKFQKNFMILKVNQQIWHQIWRVHGIQLWPRAHGQHRVPVQGRRLRRLHRWSHCAEHGSHRVKFGKHHVILVHHYFLLIC